MKQKLTMAAFLALSTATVSLPSSAGAQDYSHRHGHHDDRGRDDYGRHRCGGGNGAVGTIAGGAGGALVGRHFDKQHTRHERGC